MGCFVWPNYYSDFVAYKVVLTIIHDNNICISIIGPIEKCIELIVRYIEIARGK